MNTTYHRAFDRAISVLTASALAAWGYLHYRTLQHVSVLRSPRELTYLAAYIILCWQTILLIASRRFTATSDELDQLRRLKTVIPVPVRNEDPALLKRALASLFTQTRLPDIIHVVDNDSDDPQADYNAVSAWFQQRCHELGIEGIWERVEWRGKRQVHGHVAKAHEGRAHIFLTVDSDGILAPDAVHEIMLPFADPRVQGVTGLILADNANANILARIVDLWFAGTQLVARAAQSTLGAVTVNSGPLAAYRMAVVTDNLDSYLGERFLGREVHFSDDSMLTLYALTEGRVVQNPHAIVLVAMPENLSHHVRQYLRWMRGSTIRTIWRFRYLPITGYAYWVNLFNWVQMLASAAVLTDLFVWWPIEGKDIPWGGVAIVACLIGYFFTARYLTVKRSDEPYYQRVFTWLLAPLAVAWSYTSLRYLRWYGVATCARTGWGTRARIEVFDRQNALEAAVNNDDTLPDMQPVTEPAQRRRRAVWGLAAALVGAVAVAGVALAPDRQSAATQMRIAPALVVSSSPSFPTVTLPDPGVSVAPSTIAGRPSATPPYMAPVSRRQSIPSPTPTPTHRRHKPVPVSASPSPTGHSPSPTPAPPSPSPSPSGSASASPTGPTPSTIPSTLSGASSASS